MDAQDIVSDVNYIMSRKAYSTLRKFQMIRAMRRQYPAHTSLVNAMVASMAVAVAWDMRYKLAAAPLLVTRLRCSISPGQSLLSREN